MFNVKMFIMIAEGKTYIPFGPLIIQQDLRTVANIDCEMIYFTDYAKNPSNYDLHCDLILFSNSPNIVSKHDFEIFVKRIHEAGTPIYIGGSYVTPEYIEKVCKPNNIEYAFVGEGDKLNAEIVLDILNHQSLEKYYKHLYVKDSGQDTSKLEFRNAPIQNRPRLIHVPEWILNRSEFCCLEVSRGCPKQLYSPCSFCSYAKNFRTRQLEDILAEAHDLYDRKIVTTFVGNSNFNKEIITKIVTEFPEVNFNITIELTEAEQYLDFIESNRLQNLSLMIGVESFCEERLRLLNKSNPNKIEERLNIVKLCHDKGIPLDINILIGIPGETQEMLLKEKEVLDKYPFIREQAEVRLVYKEYYSNYQQYSDMQSYFDLYYFDEPYNKVEHVSVLKEYFDKKLERLYDKLTGEHNCEIENLLQE